jgi:hypothetical protein
MRPVAFVTSHWYLEHAAPCGLDAREDSRYSICRSALRLSLTNLSQLLRSLARDASAEVIPGIMEDRQNLEGGFEGSS